MLKRLGATNVLTFSYGRSGNLESIISQTVAQKLGFTWEFVPYSLKRWREWVSSRWWEDYLDYGGQGCTLAHLQDFPAVWELKRLRRLEENAVFVPGHTADVISGSHLPLSLESCSSLSCGRVVQALLARHYNLRGLHDPLLLSALERRIEATGIKGPIVDLDQATSLMEMWEWQERQAKFIINAVRAYEFWGFEWRIPFWDAEFVDLWSHVPCSLRFGQRLYSKYVGRVFKAVGLAGVHSSHSPRTQENIRSRIKQVILDCMRTRSVVGALLRRGAIIASYWSHPLAWYGIHSFGDHLRQVLHLNALDANFNINSVLVKYELARWGIGKQVPSR
jgi:asparagine synthase (glutamine-hydrolysing)